MGIGVVVMAATVVTGVDCRAFINASPFTSLMDVH
jgi:hypothetical protein